MAGAVQFPLSPSTQSVTYQLLFHRKGYLASVKQTYSGFLAFPLLDMLPEHVGDVVKITRNHEALSRDQYVNDSGEVSPQKSDIEVTLIGPTVFSPPKVRVSERVWTPTKGMPVTHIVMESPIAFTNGSSWENYLNGVETTFTLQWEEKKDLEQVLSWRVLAHSGEFARFWLESLGKEDSYPHIQSVLSPTDRVEVKIGVMPQFTAARKRLEYDAGRRAMSFNLEFLESVDPLE